MKEFHGRVIQAQNWTGEAVVSHQGFNTFASCQTSALFATSTKIIVSDKTNTSQVKLFAFQKPSALRQEGWSFKPLPYAL